MPARLSPSLSLYIRTLSHLKTEQILYRMWYAARSLAPGFLRKKPAPVPQKSKWNPVKPQVPFPCYPQFEAGKIDKGHFQFLNSSAEYNSRIDWQAQGKNRLWLYNLHYFNYLHPKGELERQTAIRLMGDWILNNPPGTNDSWDPFPVSLRLVNWIKYLSRVELSRKQSEPIARSIYQHALWLEASLERHLLANHLFKNLKALVFSGLFFEGRDADRWLAKGLRLMDREIQEQITTDGGHFERSPMYHSMILEDCLDLLNILNEKPQRACEGVTLLSSVCQGMIGFLTGMLHPDKGIALFNDSAFGIELPPSQILAYGSSLIQNLAGSAKGRSWSFPKSGYYVIAPNENDRMIIDCGPIGPDYQPGHAHCDTLSYELSLDGQRVIVDSGVYDYEKSDMRQYVRSTSAHNTIMVDEEEQSEIWGAFRVARRANPIFGRIEELGPDRIRFSGAHDGYRRLSGDVVHERYIEYNAPQGWEVQDGIKGSGRHHVQNSIHIHPDLKAVVKGMEVQLLDKKNGARKARIVLPKDAVVRLEKSWYCPEFGLKLENDHIILSQSNDLPIEMTYRILKN